MINEEIVQLKSGLYQQVIYFVFWKYELIMVYIALELEKKNLIIGILPFLLSNHCFYFNFIFFNTCHVP